jgi:hypothetical protein
MKSGGVFSARCIRIAVFDSAGNDHSRVIKLIKDDHQVVIELKLQKR